MAQDYIAAGFDPARFWEITPRLYVLEMQAAQERLKRERAMVWWTAMMPHAKEPPSFEAFTGYKPDRSEQIKRWAAAWDKVDRALSRKSTRTNG